MHVYNSRYFHAKIDRFLEICTLSEKDLYHATVRSLFSASPLKPQPRNACCKCSNGTFLHFMRAARVQWPKSPTIPSSVKRFAATGTFPVFLQTRLTSNRWATTVCIHEKGSRSMLVQFKHQLQWQFLL